MSYECSSECAWCWGGESFFCRKAAIHVEVNDCAAGPEARCCIVNDIRVAVGYCQEILLGVAFHLEVDGRTAVGCTR